MINKRGVKRGKSAFDPCLNYSNNEHADGQAVDVHG